MHHTELLVWRRSILLTKEIYRIAELMPNKEQFCLASQMKRSAVSIASNIAEGAARQSTKDYLRFLFIARGSLMELHTQYIIGVEIDLITKSAETSGLLETTAQLLNAQIKKLKSFV